MTPSERRFREIAHRKHWHVVRPSWPDFLCVEDGRLFAVECKHNNDWVSGTQRKTFDLLLEHGFPVYVWHSAFRHTIFPWDDVREIWGGRYYPTRALAKHLRAKE